MTLLRNRVIAIYSRTHGEAAAHARMTDWDRAVLQAVEEAIGAATQPPVLSSSTAPRSEFHSFRPMRLDHLAKKPEQVE